MAYSYSVNNSPATGAVAMYLLRAALVAAGWAVEKDSDGTTYSASGVQVTSGASGANGLGNNRAWFVIRAPAVGGVQRSLCFQRSASANTDWRIKYSPAAGFSGGSPSATQVPSATDEQVLIGSGTDGSITAAIIFGNDNSYKFHVAAGGSAEFYSFVAWTLANGGGTSGMTMFLDVLATGSYDASDPDPAVVSISNTGTIVTGAVLNQASSTSNKGFLGSVSSSNFVGITGWGYGYGSSIMFPGSGGVYPFTTKDVHLPMMYGRPSTQSAPYGYKGFSTLFRVVSVTRTNMDTFDVLGSKDRVYLGGLSVPWSGATPSL